MLPKELENKIRYIQIHSNKIVNEMLAGEYHSVFKGRGMEFEEVREYQFGDEIRAIDWNVTARTGHPYVKRYVEERELTLLFLVDLSASGGFGSAEKTKSELAAEICALLAFTAIKNNDKVGLLIFSDHIEYMVPPGKGSTHVLRIIRDLLLFEPKGIGTDIAGALGYVSQLTKKKCVVFLLSDFQDAGYEDAMRRVALRHDLIAVNIADPRELELPKAGLMLLRDPETGKQRIVDTSSARVRRAYAQATEAARRALRSHFWSMAVDHIEIGTDKDYVRELIRFFRARERRQSGAAVR